MADKQKSVASRAPSVYSAGQIARHRNKILASQESSDDDESVSGSIGEYSDALDINVRIFEDHAHSDKIVAEMSCTVKNTILQQITELCSVLEANRSKADESNKIIDCQEAQPEKSHRSIQPGTSNSGHENNDPTTQADITPNNSEVKEITKHGEQTQLHKIKESYLTEEKNLLINQKTVKNTPVKKTVVKKTQSNPVGSVQNICIDHSVIDSGQGAELKQTNIPIGKEGIRATQTGKNVVDFEEYEVSDEESFKDLNTDIITAKPIIKKKASPTVTKINRQKATEAANSMDNSKRTIYDLIYSYPKKRKTAQVKGEEQSDEDDVTELKEEVEEIVTDNSVKQETAEEEETDSTAPRVTVDAEGNIVLDDKSLVVEQSAMIKTRENIGKNGIIFETDNIHRRCKKYVPVRAWSAHETLKFYILLSHFGTDFTMIERHFPSRGRKCIKKKFLKEERSRPELINNALQMRDAFNIQGVKKCLASLDKRVEIAKQKSVAEEVAKKKEHTDKKQKTEASKLKRQKKRKYSIEKILFENHGTEKQEE